MKARGPSKSCVILLAAAGLVTAITSAVHGDTWQVQPPLPVNRANNAVASHTFADTCYVYSFMGIDETRIWSGIRQDAWRLNTVTGVWQQLPDVPGSVGRIAAAAASVGDRVYLFGGYEVTAGGFEITRSNVDIFDPATMSWSSGTPIPQRVDDQVIGVWNEQLIYLISGWSQNQNVSNVQVYDPAGDTWEQATPIIGPPVFGAAGGIVGNDIIYADGVNNAFSLIAAAYRGTIDPGDPTTISWAALPQHPGPALYRMASGVELGPTTRVHFAAGTDNAHNFNGIGYDGNPWEPADAPRTNAGILLRAAPVPARREVSIDFRLLRAVETRVTIHDVNGRRLRTLQAGMLPAGRHRVSWDLHDAHRRRVARGVYVARVEYGRGERSVKIVVDGS